MTKKLSQEFCWTKSRTLGAQSQLDEFLQNPLTQGHSGGQYEEEICSTDKKFIKIWLKDGEDYLPKSVQYRRRRELNLLLTWKVNCVHGTRLYRKKSGACYIKSSRQHRNVL